MCASHGDDAFPSPRGGAASKVADLYERAWTVRSLLDLLSGHLTEIQLERQGPEGLGVEFRRRLRSGEWEYHSAKRQAPDSASRWTVARMVRPSENTGRSVLGDLFSHLDGPLSARAVFVSQDSVQHLRECSERALGSTDPAEFFDRLSGAQRNELERHIVPLVGSRSNAYEKLRRCIFTAVEHRELVQIVEERISSTIQSDDGTEANPKVVRTALEDFAWSRLGQTISMSAVSDALLERGFAVRPLSVLGQERERIRTHNDAYVNRIRRSLVNGAYIPRLAVEPAIDRLVTGGESLILTGAAGIGKSCMLAQIVEQLTDMNVPCLVISGTDLRGVYSASELGQRLGFRDSPAIEMGEGSQGQRAILCIDQIDALGFDAEFNELGQNVLNEVLEQASRYKNLKLLLACRSYDLDAEASLKWIVAGDSAIASRVSLEELDDREVRRALHLAEVPESPLSASQMQILRVPLHLFLYLEASESRRPDFANVDDLFDAFWREKERAVRRRLRDGVQSWTPAVVAMCDTLGRRESTVAPAYEIEDSHPAELEAMASEAVVYREGRDVGFFHESFFEYAFGRTFSAKGLSLVAWLLSDSQSLFRRRQVIGRLTFLRRQQQDRRQYLETLEDLLVGGEIRFHIRRLVLEWLRELPSPWQDEWQILEAAGGVLGDHVWDVPNNSVPWFDLLMEMGLWDAWFRGGDSEIDRAIRLLGSQQVLTHRIDAIIGLLDQYGDHTQVWRDRLWSIARWGDGYEYRVKCDWLLRLIAAEELSSPKVIAARAGLIAQIIYGIKERNPQFAPRVIGSWFDKLLPSLTTEASTEPYVADLHLQIDGWNIEECAKAAPIEFVSELFPRLVRFEQVAPMRFLDAPRHSGYRERGLRVLVAEALTVVAVTAPQLLRGLRDATEEEDLVWTRWMSAALLTGLSANPSAYADEIVGFILDDPRRRLDIGYDYGSGGADLFVAVSRNAVAASSAECSDSTFRLLEDAILTFRPQEERSMERTAAIQLALLCCLPEDRLSPVARDRKSVLEARFPDLEARGAPQDSDDEDVGWAVSPIPEEEALGTSNGQWLELMKRTRDPRASHEAGRFVGGSIELSRTLEGATAQDPARFSALIEDMDRSLSPDYFEAILGGLTRSEEGAPRPGTVSQVHQVLKRIEQLGVDIPGAAVARAIGAIADEAVPDELIYQLCDIAINDPDPTEDNWPGGDGPLAPINQAINTARGTAAEAISKLLFANRKRWRTVEETVLQLVADPILAVRSTAVLCLIAILDTNRNEALLGFRRLVEGAHAIVSSRFVEDFIHRARFRDYEAMRPTLHELLLSETQAASRVAARQIVLTALFSDVRDAREDEQYIRSLSRGARAGAADIYAANVADADVGDYCASQLSGLFRDNSEEVRAAAARCWYTLSPNQTAERGSLIGDFADSPAFEETRTTGLLRQLQEASVPLPVETCKLAERALETYGDRALSIQHMEAFAAKTLANLLLRLLDETSDQAVKERVSDVLDEMIRARFYGVLEELEDRRNG